MQNSRSLAQKLAKLWQLVQNRTSLLYIIIGQVHFDNSQSMDICFKDAALKSMNPQASGSQCLDQGLTQSSMKTELKNLNNDSGV